MTKNQILQQAAATVLSQANQAPQLALKLLG
ncbi:MAG: flagellin, partial [Vampirovibrionales bacterium]